MCRSLDYAVRNKNLQMTRVLLENGADIDEFHSFRRSPLCLAAQYGFFDMAKLLVDLGAQVDQRDIFASPLHFAAENGWYDIVVFLVQCGADVNAAARYGGYHFSLFYTWATVLSKAVEAGHFKIAQFLIQHGAEVSTQEEERKIRNLQQNYDWRADKAAFQQAWLAGLREHFDLPDDIAELILVVAGIMPLRASECDDNGSECTG